MSKKNADHAKDDEKDLEEEDEEGEEEGDEEEEDEEEEEQAASAKPVDSRRARPRAPRLHDDHDDHHDESDEEDPTWWTPHAVLSVLVLVGVLGFFGVFNKLVAGIMPKPGATAEDKTATAKPPEQRDEFGARHLLVMYKGSFKAPPTITRTEEEAKARATEAMKKAKGGAKFEDIAKEYSDEPGASRSGGDLGKFKKGQMVPEFQNAVEKLKVGEVSDLVKTQFGYHVIQRTQ